MQAVVKKSVANSIWLVLVISTVVIGYVRFRSFKYAEEIPVVNTSPREKHVRISYDDSTEKVIPLDGMTSPEVIAYCAISETHEKTTHFTYLNQATAEIYFHEHQTGYLSHRVDLKKYGITPDQKVQGYYLLNSDSLLVYCYEGTQLRMLSLSKGPLLGATMADPFDSNAPETVFPYVTNGSPIKFNKADSSIYLCGFIADEGGGASWNKRRRVMSTLNLATGEKENFAAYPEMYARGNWGGSGGYRQAFYDLNSSNKLVISFMADHRLTIFDAINKTQEYAYAGSQFIDTIKSMKYAPNYFDFISKDEKRQYLQHASYYSVILHDDYRNLYYRFAELPISNGQTSRKITVIILNSDFEKIGEALLPENKYILRNFFIDQSGLWLEKRLNSENEIAFGLIHFNWNEN